MDEDGRAPGSLIFSTYGWRAKGLDDLPQQLKDLLAKPEYALFREPPPANDTRPMADEFTYFEQVMKAEGKK